MTIFRESRSPEQIKRMNASPQSGLNGLDGFDEVVEGEPVDPVGDIQIP